MVTPAPSTQGQYESTYISPYCQDLFDQLESRFVFGQIQFPIDPNQRNYTPESKFKKKVKFISFMLI